MGRNAIMRKLIRLGVPTKLGGRWAENTVASILTNEKVAGDLCLQKGYISDHLTKQKRVNHGELPKYYVEGAHEAIIDRATFDAVQAEVTRRARENKPVCKEPRSEFCGIIRCDRCGANFNRKINGIGTKYAKANWACATYTIHGTIIARQSVSRRIFSGKNVRKPWGVTLTTLPSSLPGLLLSRFQRMGFLVFTFKDGTQKTILWEKQFPPGQLDG